MSTYLLAGITVTNNRVYEQWTEEDYQDVEQQQTLDVKQTSDVKTHKKWGVNTLSKQKAKAAVNTKPKTEKAQKNETGVDEK